jgi:dGTPase
MGVGEGDFHRTRLTHSLEVAQIGYGILEVLQKRKALLPSEIQEWLPNRDLVEAACFAHDLGHPPFGHKGEQALHQAMFKHGGFEGNGQTLRILSRLEKYKVRGKGIFPTRRLVLGVLKYPCAMDAFEMKNHTVKPPKCYHREEKDVVQWALEGFSEGDRNLFQEVGKSKPKHHSFDCSILELADDIAYGVHDVEDIVARGLATSEVIRTKISKALDKAGETIAQGKVNFTADYVSTELLADSFRRKQIVSELVNLFITNVRIAKKDRFEHPLLSYQVELPPGHTKLLKAIKSLAYELVIKEAKVQQLERRGQMIVAKLYNELVSAPTDLIPSSSWNDGCKEGTIERRVCDYIAGMTDDYAQKLYKRLFSPGYGSSGDEL